MQAWQKAWREGIAPQLSDNALVFLRAALENDDAALIQGATTTPPPLTCTQDWPCEAACLISYCGWHGNDLETVGEVEEFFARTCYECDQLLGEPAGVRHFLNWYDETPRHEMRAAMIKELHVEICKRVPY